MNRTPRRRAAPVAASFVAVLALGLAACSGDDDDADTTTTATELDTLTTDGGVEETTEPEISETETTGLDDTSDPDGTTEGSGGATADESAYVDAAAGALALGDEETSQCLAEALIGTIGMDRIEASGVSPEEFVAGDSLAALDLGVAEDDAPGLQAEMDDCGDLVDAFLASSGITEEQADCARPELTDELVAELIVSGLAELPPSADLEAASATIQECTAG